jgi:Alginate lyase
MPRMLGRAAVACVVSSSLVACGANHPSASTPPSGTGDDGRSAASAGPKPGDGIRSDANSPARSAGKHAAGSLPAGTPKTTVLVGSQIASAQRQLAEGGTPEQQAALAALTKIADGLVAAGPWSVMDKAKVPPSGDKHDYMSQAVYWWPADASPPGNPGTPGQCPYKSWDGVRNVGEVDPPALTDATYLKRTFEGIFQLALAWYYTGDGRYAARAELFARNWFLEPATLMHPNMNFAQGVPCGAAGRGDGIIEASAPYVGDLVDGLAVLDVGAPGWTPADQAGVRAWLTQLLTWLQTSAVGLEEAKHRNRNNHESWYDSAVASLGVYVGRPSAVTSVLRDGMELVDLQFLGDGSQPKELGRTRAWHYSNFNGHALCRLAEVGRKVGVDLWAHAKPGGASLATGIDYLIGWADRVGQGDGGFVLPASSPAQIEKIDPSELFYELHAAAADASDAKAAAALSRVPPPEGVDMWSLVPSCRVAGHIPP